MRSPSWRFICLMVQCVSLTNAMRDALLIVASEMMRGRGTRRKVLTDDISGIVRTDFRFGMLGSASGIIFSADVETEFGSGKIHFLAHPAIAGLEPEEIVRGGEWEDVTDDFARAGTAVWN